LVFKKTPNIFENGWKLSIITLIITFGPWLQS
jgi:hypothetical protein